MLSQLKTSALAAAAAALFASPAFAITPANDCSFGDVSGAGVAVTDCTGYYIGNLNNAADFDAGGANGVQALLMAEFPGIVLGDSILEQQAVASGADFNFLTPVSGEIVLGVHWGGGAGGGHSSFYRVTLGLGFGGFDIVGTNPALGRGGISNVALYSTTVVPEPETYALMLAGLAAVGFVSRRRKKA